jgi:hypothetical protein
MNFNLGIVPVPDSKLKNNKKIWTFFPDLNQQLKAYLRGILWKLEFSEMFQVPVTRSSGSVPRRVSTVEKHWYKRHSTWNSSYISNSSKKLVNQNKMSIGCRWRVRNESKKYRVQVSLAIRYFPHKFQTENTETKRNIINTFYSSFSLFFKHTNSQRTTNKGHPYYINGSFYLPQSKSCYHFQR